MGRTVYITGAASGIGRELARRYVRQGWNAFLFDRAELEGAVAEMKSLAGSEQTLQGLMLDVSDEASVNTAFSEAAGQLAPDLVINCAGILSCEPFTNSSGEDFERVIRVNLIGSRHVAASAVTHLRPGGQLVLVASLAGVAACYGYTAYCAAKHGVVGLADVLRMELKPLGITVSLVCPPEVETPMVVEERKTRAKATSDIKALGGLLTVEEAASQIEAGVARRDFMIIPGRRARFMYWTTRITPRVLNNRLADFLVSRGQN